MPNPKLILYDLSKKRLSYKDATVCFANPCCSLLFTIFFLQIPPFYSPKWSFPLFISDPTLFLTSPSPPNSLCYIFLDCKPAGRDCVSNLWMTPPLIVHSPLLWQRCWSPLETVQTHRIVMILLSLLVVLIFFILATLSAVWNDSVLINSTGLVTFG